MMPVARPGYTFWDPPGSRLGSEALIGVVYGCVGFRLHMRLEGQPGYAADHLNKSRQTMIGRLHLTVAFSMITVASVLHSICMSINQITHHSSTYVSTCILRYDDHNVMESKSGSLHKSHSMRQRNILRTP